MKWFPIAAAVANSVSLVLGQTPIASKWCTTEISGAEICFYRYRDVATDTSWGFTFPTGPSPTGEPVTELIGFFTARSTAGWVGSSLGGGMRSNLLVVGWLNGRAPVVSLRRTEAYGPPGVLATPGPVLTILGGSGLTSANQQRIIYRCQNCTSWTGGSGGINLNSTAASFGFATHGSAKPNPPSNAAAGVSRHTLVGQYSLDVTQAKTGAYWNNLAALKALPPLP